MYIRGMYSNINLFKIETNHVVPAQGKVLISEPFLCDHMFGRSVILLVDHTHDGTMGLVLNKPLPLFLNDVLKDFDCPESIPIYKEDHSAQIHCSICTRSRVLPERCPSAKAST